MMPWSRIIWVGNSGICRRRCRLLVRHRAMLGNSGIPLSVSDKKDRLAGRWSGSDRRSRGGRGPRCPQDRQPTMGPGRLSKRAVIAAGADGHLRHGQAVRGMIDTVAFIRAGGFGKRHQRAARTVRGAARLAATEARRRGSGRETTPRQSAAAEICRDGAAPCRHPSCPRAPIWPRPATRRPLTQFAPHRDRTEIGSPRVPAYIPGTARRARSLPWRPSPPAPASWS